MKIEMQIDGTNKETYENITEYRNRGLVLARTIGRRQLVYEGWLNGELVRIY